MSKGRSSRCKPTRASHPSARSRYPASRAGWGWGWGWGSWGFSLPWRNPCQLRRSDDARHPPPPHSSSLFDLPHCAFRPQAQNHLTLLVCDGTRGFAGDLHTPIPHSGATGPKNPATAREIPADLQRGRGDFRGMRGGALYWLRSAPSPRQPSSFHRQLAIFASITS